jgi:hypothetical protein
MVRPTSVALAVKLLTSIREVLGSNLSRDSGYSDSFFRGFLQHLQANARIVP